MHKITSQMTFLYVKDMDKAAAFIEKSFQAKLVFAPSWAKVYQTAEKAFIGLVGAEEGSIAHQGNKDVLISFTTSDLDWWLDHFKKIGLDHSPVKDFTDLGLTSIFLDGPEGYTFEIQSFYDKALANLF